MKKITLQQLLDKEACVDGIVLFHKLGLTEVDWNTVTEIRVPENQVGNVRWLVKNMGLTSLTLRSNIFLYVFDDQGNLLRIECNDGYWETYQYDDQGNCLKIEDSNGSWETCQYDDHGNLLRTERNDGLLRTWTYDGQGNLIACDSSNFTDEDIEKLRSEMSI